MILKSLKNEPLGNNGKKFINKKQNAPSCKEFLEIIQFLIFLKIKKKLLIIKLKFQLDHVLIKTQNKFDEDVYQEYSFLL